MKNEEWLRAPSGKPMAAQMVFIKHKEIKKRRIILDTKVTSDLKVATKYYG